MSAYKADMFPKRLEIEISNNCNLHCSYCPRRYLDGLSGFIDKQLFIKIIDEASLYPQTVLVLHRRGESMLHPCFGELLLYAAGKFKEIQIATNATLLDKDKFELITKSLTFISFSIDVPDVYDKTRAPARYSLVEEKILRFLAFNKGKVKTQVSMVKTMDTPEENAALFKKIWDGKVDRIRIYEEHSIGGVFGAIRSPRPERKPCMMPVYEMLIYSDGKIGRCNHDWDGEPMGDINIQKISEVWHSEKYNQLRRQHTKLEFYDPVCAKCDSWYAEIGNQGTGEVLEK